MKYMPDINYINLQQCHEYKEKVNELTVMDWYGFDMTTKNIKD